MKQANLYKSRDCVVGSALLTDTWCMISSALRIAVDHAD